MAKAKETYVKISGKLEDKVFVNSQKRGYHVRKAPPQGIKKNEPAFKKQHSRTIFLNKLASELNRILKLYSDNFKSHNFYATLLKRFRKEPLNNRFLLLLQLQGMDLNSQYPFFNLGACNTIVRGLKSNIAVSLQTQRHPEPGKYDADCYCYEVTMLSWTKSKKQATHSRQYGDWIRIDGGHEEFDFQFPRPAGTTHWMLCLRQRLGVKEKEVEAFEGESMQIADIGTFDKKEIALVKKRAKDLLAKKPAKKIKENVVRVKAKKR